MGRMKENPRYNILSTRADDASYFAIIESANVAGCCLAEFILTACQEKVSRDCQLRMDEHLRAHGVK